MQEMSENGADVSWDDVGKVLEEEMSSTEDIQADLVRNNKGNICQSMQKHFRNVIPICICLIVLCIWMKQRHTCTLIIFRLQMAIKQA